MQDRLFLGRLRGKAHGYPRQQPHGGLLRLQGRSDGDDHGDHVADNIRVNCVCPGSIDTEMIRTLFRSANDAVIAKHDRPAGKSR